MRQITILFSITNVLFHHTKSPKIKCTKKIPQTEDTEYLDQC